MLGYYVTHCKQNAISSRSVDCISLMLMKRNVWRRSGDAHQQSPVAMAGLTQTQDHPHSLHTHTRTVVGYFKLCKTNSSSPFFDHCVSECRCGVGARGRRGWKGWRLGMGWEREHIPKCQQAGSEEPLVIQLTFAPPALFHVLSQTKPSCRQTSSPTASGPAL